MWSSRRSQSTNYELFAEYLCYCTELHEVTVYCLFSDCSLKNYLTIY